MTSNYGNSDGSDQIVAIGGSEFNDSQSQLSIRQYIDAKSDIGSSYVRRVSSKGSDNSGQLTEIRRETSSH